MDAVLTRFPFWESDTGTITLNQGSGFILIIYMVGQCRAGAAVPEGVSILDTPSCRRGRPFLPSQSQPPDGVCASSPPGGAKSTPVLRPQAGGKAKPPAFLVGGS